MQYFRIAGEKRSEDMDFQAYNKILICKDDIENEIGRAHV